MRLPGLKRVSAIGTIVVLDNLPTLADKLDELTKRYAGLTGLVQDQLPDRPCPYVYVNFLYLSEGWTPVYVGQSTKEKGRALKHIGWARDMLNGIKATYHAPKAYYALLELMRTHPTHATLSRIMPYIDHAWHYESLLIEQIGTRKLGRGPLLNDTAGQFAKPRDRFPHIMADPMFNVFKEVRMD